MKKFLLLLLICCGCFSLSAQTRFRPSQITFIKQDTCFAQPGQNCEELMRKQIMSMGTQVIEGLKQDTTLGDTLLDMASSAMDAMLSKMVLTAPKETLRIISKGDSILRQHPEERTFERIGMNGVIRFFDDETPDLETNRYEVFARPNTYTVKAEPNNRKQILGFNTYKITITEKELPDPDMPIRFGDTIYEMYVTDQIDLPLQALLYINTQNLPTKPSWFPLEVKVYSSTAPELVTLQRAVEIKK